MRWRTCGAATSRCGPAVAAGAPGTRHRAAPRPPGALHTPAQRAGGRTRGRPAELAPVLRRCGQAADGGGARRRSCAIQRRARCAKASRGRCAGERGAPPGGRAATATPRRLRAQRPQRRLMPPWLEPAPGCSPERPVVVLLGVLGAATPMPPPSARCGFVDGPHTRARSKLSQTREALLPRTHTHTHAHAQSSPG